MKIAPLARVKDQFSAFVQECKTSPIVITKNGKPVAMLVSVTDEDDLDSLLLANDPRFIALLERGYRSIQDTGGVKSKEFWKRVGRRKPARKR